MKKIYFACLLAATALSTQAQSTNPLYHAQGFNVFTKTSLTLVSGDTHGGVATGGDLNLNGATSVALNTTGTYPNGLNNANNYGMVIGGKINYSSGNVSYINNGYLRIGNTAGTNLYATDNNNAAVNLRATNGTFDANPRVEVQRQQSVASATSGSGINFTTAFNELQNNSALINLYKTTGSCSGYNYITVPSGSNPHITLSGTKPNYLALTATQLTALNAQGSIIFDNHPDATHQLFINVSGTGTYNWVTPNLGGVNEADGAYILINFPEVTSLTFSGGNSIYGSVLAPYADVYKTGANNNNGQIVSKSLSIAYGEIHYFAFAGSVPSCGPIPPTTQIYPVNTYTNATATPLALSAVTLKGAVVNGVQTLYWNAQADNLSASYSVERSNDGKSFITLSTIKSMNSIGSQNYELTDAEGAKGTQLYRVRVLATDGAVGYSNTIQVRNEAATTTATVSPMPFHDVLNVKLNVAENTQYKVVLADITGRVMLQTTITGAGTAALDGVSNLANGVYILRVTDNNNMPVVMQKVVKN